MNGFVKKKVDSYYNMHICYYKYRLYAGFEVTMGVRSLWKPMYRCPEHVARGIYFGFQGDLTSVITRDYSYYVPGIGNSK